MQWIAAKRATLYCHSETMRVRRYTRKGFVVLGWVSPVLSSVPNVSHRFFGRVGGTSPNPWRSLNTSLSVRDAPARVEENLARVRFQIGVPKAALFTCTQVHGNSVLRIHPDDDTSTVLDRQADGLVTHNPGVAVGVRTADCVPVLMAIDDGSGIASAHAGWRGTVADVVGRTLAQLTDDGRINHNRVVCAIGPAIGAEAFEVGSDVVDGLQAARLGIDVMAFVQKSVHSDDKWHVDLRGLIQAQLHHAGVKAVDLVGGCTFGDEELYFSHRRDVTKRQGEETGRQLSVIATVTPPVVDEALFR